MLSLRCAALTSPCRLCEHCGHRDCLNQEAVLDPVLVEQARDLWWSRCPSEYVRKDEPDSWLGGFDGPDQDELAKLATESNSARGLHWGCREVGGTEVRRWAYVGIERLAAQRLPKSRLLQVGETLAMKELSANF